MSTTAIQIGNPRLMVSSEEMLKASCFVSSTFGVWPMHLNKAEINW